VPTTTVTANYTINPTTDFVVLCNAAGTGPAGVTITLPAAASNTGHIFVIKRINPVVGASSSNRCFLTPVGGGTLTPAMDAPDAGLTNINSGFWVVSDGTNWWTITGSP
jgi:hypothetical protein